jgi:hypothetical protein
MKVKKIKIIGERIHQPDFLKGGNRGNGESRFGNSVRSICCSNSSLVAAGRTAAAFSNQGQSGPIKPNQEIF